MSVVLVRRLVLASILPLFFAAWSDASTLTLNFSGSIDLSSVGGPAAGFFSGALTWNPLAAQDSLLCSDPIFNCAGYSYNSGAVSGSFQLDGTDYSSDIYTAGPTNGSAFVTTTIFDFGFSFVGTAPPTFGSIVLETFGMGFKVASTAPFALPSQIPTDVAFTNFLFEDDSDSVNPVFPVLSPSTVTASDASSVVPEPATVVLMAFGLGVLAVVVRNSKSVAGGITN